ncbi:hypothetical protein NA57DRAFT_43108, partial [Rhizodiscina lignyota]
MVLDGFTALALAGNVIQFVDFCSKLLSSTYEIYESADGAPERHVHLAKIEDDFSDFIRNLSLGPRGATGGAFPSNIPAHEKAVEKLARGCMEDAKRLRNILKELRRDEDPKISKIWQSFRQALRSYWKEGRIRELERRLNDVKSELLLRLVGLLSDRQSDVLRILDDLSDANRRMEIDRNKQIQDLASKVESFGHSVSGMISKADFKTFHKTVSDLASTSSDLLVEQKILESLRFKQMRVRRSIIPEAHTKTFQWIFDNHDVVDDPKSRIKFVHWLKQPNIDSGMFWISGKPGSGKSTLMKFICNHPQTVDALRVWSGRNKLVTASFFFWHSGTTKQRSQEGLLQTLLYEILRKCPDAISVALPHRLKSASQEPWDRAELFQTLRMLRGKLKASTCFCFFVDGLDEYFGDPRDILGVLQDISAEENVKICASSRPWPIFQTAFDGYHDRRICLQDLTRDDIALYVRNKLEEDPTFVHARKEDDRYDQLVVEIVDKAQGVFFWVFLVVRSLLDGLTNADTLQTLQKRLRLLPSDLEEYFQHMLDSVDDIYQTQMARTFQLSLTCDEPLYLLIHFFLDDLEEDPSSTLKMDVQPWRDNVTLIREMEKANLTRRESQMQKRIAARSMGLLEVRRDEDYAGDTLGLHRVDFLHRTVAEFLKHPSLQKRFAQQIGPLFDPNASTAHAILGMVKAI